MNKFTVRPNKSVADIIKGNCKRRVIMVSPDGPRLREFGQSSLGDHDPFAFEWPLFHKPPFHKPPCETRIIT